jgi:glycosyltransferase involved in cell wall biosynthesis
MKLTEALAMGVPVLARETPSLAPFVRAGVIATVGDTALDARIGAMFDDPDAMCSLSRRGRDYFLSHLSYQAARRTINRVIAGLPTDSGDVPAAWERACELASSAVARS